MNRWLLYTCLVLPLWSHTLAINEKVIQVDNFLANVNLSEPKLFYVRNNLDGDIEFQESQNASLSVHMSAEEKELERIKVEYDLLDGGTIVDIQVFIVPETTTNWPLIGGLAGAGVFVAVVIVIGILVFRKRRTKQRLKIAKREDKLEMTDCGKVVSEKVAVFEKPQSEEETVLDDHDTGRPRNRSTLMEKKIATFERPEPTEKAAEKEEETKNAEQTSKEIRSQSYLEVAGKRPDSEVSRRSTSPRPQSSTFLSARAAFLVLTLIAVALATSKAPSARIIIRVPANFVRNGSKIFFNKDFHGRLLMREGMKVEMQNFRQFAVSPASSKVPSLEKCSSSCEFGCDVLTKECVCLRGYEMIGGSCHDIDECTSKKHNCHVQSTCNNTVGGFTCTCKDGYWGEGITCKACSTKPCPENFYQSDSCTRTHDRVCTACSPKCDKMTYQAYGCGLTFDQKCIDISKPLTLTKDFNDSDTLDVRSGSKLIVLEPAKNFVLLEDRLRLNSTSETFFLQGNSPNSTRLHRNSSFHVDVKIEQVHLIPKFTDYDAWRSNGENLEFATVPGFSEVFSKHCRYPAPNHYTIKHDLQRNRQTQVYPAKCFKHARSLCPTGVTPGEIYHYRSLNDACNTTETSVICAKPNQADCNLKADSSKLYCTNYTNIVTDVFGINEGDFLDSPLQAFPTVLCAETYRICRMCRDGCSSCEQASSQAGSSCSCCYKDCLDHCSTFYRQPNCEQIPKRCAKGDTSQFTLTMDKPTNMNLQFNCYLEYNVPKTLYTLSYRVQHNSGRFTSDWISKTLKTPPAGDHQYSMIKQGTNRLDSLEVSHSVNFDISTLLYLRSQRASEKEPYRYSISSLEDENSTLGNANPANTIQIQTQTPFSITTRSWSDSGNCQRLTEWRDVIRKPFRNLKPVNAEHLGVQSEGQFAYHVQDPQRTPTMTVSISDEESIMKYVLTNASILNDETFKSSLSRTRSTWNTKIKGFLTSCPGFFTLQVIDEVDNVLVLYKDVVILCPQTAFNLDIHVPRKGLEDKERLFNVRLSNANQNLELQLAVVDKGARKVKEPVKKSDDEKPNPWITLMPLFVVTGCVLLFLFALILYAQVTHKPDNTPKGGPSGWKFVKNKDLTRGKPGNETRKARPKDQNRLKRRHLILVVFFVVVRVVYSLIFTFSMAFAILTLLHAENMKIIQEYQDYVQSKVDESNAMALKMDQHREREAKRGLDSVEDVQRSCDYFIGLQLQWLRFNMTCLIQENHLKMFNKLSKKIISKVTQRVEKLKRDIDERINEFRAATKRKLQDTKENLKNYGKRVFNNGWFALPKLAYRIKKGTSRKKREILENETRHQKQHQQQGNTAEKLTGKSQYVFSTRKKRSIADNFFIGFLDFVGAVDQDKLVEAENNIISKLQFAKAGLADFGEVLKTGKSPEHPLSTILMCPLRYMKKAAKEQVKKGIKTLAEESAEWAKAQANCFVGNISDFFASNDSLSEFNDNATDSETFSERVVYEEIDGADGTSNISKANRSSVMVSARGGSYYNIEKGDVFEEMVDDQKEELLQRQGKTKQVTSVYDAEVFIVTRNAILGVLVVIDILLLIYRGSKTYQIAFKLIQGFEETVDHDEDEFEENPPSAKQRAERIVRRILDFLAEKFSKFIAFCKNLHKRIMRTNLLPICIIIAASAAGLYLIVAVVYNVMNVTVIEELGGYDMIASRLDTDYRFTNLAIDDQFDFINNNAMQQYKESVNDSISEYNRRIQDFNTEQQARMDRLNRQLCSLDNDTNGCFGEQASLLDFNLQSCIIPTLEGAHYEGYDGEAYRQRLKRESKRFVDALRNIVLETIYFILAVVLSIVIIAVLSYVVFLFLKSRGMVRVKQVHVYKSLPPEILEQYHLKSPESNDDQDGDGEKLGENNGAKKVNIPKIFLTESTENVNTLKRESKA